MTRWRMVRILALLLVMAVFSAIQQGQADTGATVVVKYVPQMPPAGAQPPRAGESPTTAGHDILSSSALTRPDAWRYFATNGICDPAFSVDGGKYLLLEANPAFGRPGYVVRVASPLPKREPAEGADAWPWILVLDDGTVWVARAGGAVSRIRGESENISYFKWTRAGVVLSEYIIGRPKPGRVWTCHYVKVRYDSSKGDCIPLVNRQARIRKVWI